MAWTIEWDERAVKDVKKFGSVARRRIVEYLERRVALATDPRKLGKPLTGTKFGLWRYRVGDYRVICRIEDKQLVVLVVKVGHRKNVYD